MNTDYKKKYLKYKNKYLKLKKLGGSMNFNDFIKEFNNLDEECKSLLKNKNVLTKIIRDKSFTTTDNIYIPEMNEIILKFDQLVEKFNTTNFDTTIIKAFNKKKINFFIYNNYAKLHKISRKPLTSVRV